MKLIKLLLIAIVLVGGICGIVIWMNCDDNSIPAPDVTSEQAKMWKGRIDAMCEEGEWTAEEYENIETGVHTDRVTSNGNLISMDEERSLKKYLFALSCKYVKEGADNLFQQSTYPKGEVEHYEEVLSLLQERAADNDANSNLEDASKFYAAYHKLLNLFSFGASATYTRPLKAYSGGSANGRRATIEQLPYYKSHFCNNDDIRERVATLEADMRRAEQEYYSNLERCVEQHYRQNGRIEELLEDQIRFEEISTNSAAKERLDNFTKQQ